MSAETFHDEARRLLSNLLNETPKANHDELVDAYAAAFTQLYATESHRLLSEVIDDARNRLDARLSPDPVRQTIASVQTTVQDIWQSIWRD